MNEKLLNYYNGDDFPAKIWEDKYAVRDRKGNVLEETPDDMHRRLAKELGRIEYNYLQKEKDISNNDISDFGKDYIKKYSILTQEELVNVIFSYLKNFKYIIPQGSIMTMLGNDYKIGSLSNCFVIPAP